MSESDNLQDAAIGLDELDVVAGGASNRNRVEIDGQVTEALPNASFQVQLDDGRSIVGYLSGKMRMNFVRVTPGNRVKVEMDESDGSRGRIVYRYK